jgi:7-cyano-7-deazaguanine synthase
MDKTIAIALLSGGMDSTTAMYWAAKEFDEIIAIHFSYGQRGREWEYAAAARVCTYLVERHPVEILHIAIPGEMMGTLLRPNEDLQPGQTDKNGNPATFVPGRNLIQIALALPTVYKYDAKYIIGGWTQVDVDYPDCREPFLRSAAIACRLALGQEVDILYPLVNLSKDKIVALGQELGVPWHLTRSCYDSGIKPCGQCDSCLLRVAAFHRNFLRDPLYEWEEWDEACCLATDQGYI